MNRFPIVEVGGHEIQKLLTLTDDAGRYKIQLSMHYFEDQIEISTAITHERSDEHLVPRLQLVRDIYNVTKADFTEQGLWKFTESPKVMPPRFHLTLARQTSFQGVGEPSESREMKIAYHEIWAGLYAKYGIKNAHVEEDWLHENRAVLPVCEGYKIEITRPDSHIQNFEVSANNLVDYTQLVEISEGLIGIVSKELGDLVHVDNTPYTNCSFHINLDISQQPRLQSIGKLFLTDKNFKP